MSPVKRAVTALSPSVCWLQRQQADTARTPTLPMSLHPARVEKTVGKLILKITGLQKWYVWGLCLL